MKIRIFEFLRAHLPKSLIQLIPVRFKRLVRNHVYSKIINNCEEVNSGIPNHTIIRTIAQLEQKLLELDEAHKVSDDALRAAFQTFSMDFSKVTAPDPYSEEYRRQQFEIYALIAGKTYGVQNEATQFDVQSSASHPFPYNSKSFDTVGNHLISIGFLIKTMRLAPGARILEFGPGWGNTTECLARMGYSVTAVDIEQNFVDLISERASRNRISLTALQGDFSYIEEVKEPYDAILFFECFHHAADHLRLIKAFDGALKTGGKVFFAAEPITNDFPIPWGLRLDGESLWAIRNFGWLELGFKGQYFIETMKKFGWGITKHICPETPWGTIFIANRL